VWGVYGDEPNLEIRGIISWNRIVIVERNWKAKRDFGTWLLW
jgi:hypothetical protein